MMIDGVPNRPLYSYQQDMIAIHWTCVTPHDLYQPRGFRSAIENCPGWVLVWEICLGFRLVPAVLIEGLRTKP